MTDLVLATQNRDKERELRALLGDLGVTIQTMLDFDGVPPIVEDGDSCEANARKKAQTVAQATGLPAIADDTGLEVDALGGRPGVYAARYAGEHATYADNCRKLLEELRGIPAGKRNARFVTVAAVAFPNGHVTVARGVLEGSIAEVPRGLGGFGYDSVFFVPELGKTLAELTPDEKNRISHRAKAFTQAKELVKVLLAEGNHVGA